jgi:hypothetical protein
LQTNLQGAETWAEKHPKTIIGIFVLIARLLGWIISDSVITKIPRRTGSAGRDVSGNPLL